MLSFDGVVRVRYIERNGVTDVMTFIDTKGFNPGANDDQILLRLAHAAGSQNVTASFEFINDGIHGVTQTFNTAGNPLATAFNGEDWTRAGFGAFTPGQIPLPGTLALLALGLATIGFRRQKRGG